ncbi:hypothetical protein T12_2545 [Trichinella patagoniensis]|uniref:Uncharacterized protein n=1 Tax=Trichinella patagoniensis TaxID=990121 RepID=A0A0V1AAI7_9BILA|nr:hypothetical protein T12_2545 [Trichinella patagoniensis]
MQFTILIIALSVLCYGNALPSRPYWDHTAKPPVENTPNVMCDACAEHDYNCLVICKENALKIKGQDQHSPTPKSIKVLLIAAAAILAMSEAEEFMTNALLLEEAVDDDVGAVVVVVVVMVVVKSCKLDEFSKYEEAAAKADVSTSRWVNGVTPVGTLNGSNVKNFEGVCSMGRIGVDESNNSDLKLSSALDIVTTFKVLGLGKKIFRPVREVLPFAGESAALGQFCVAEGKFESSELNESNASRSSPDENVPGSGVHRHTGKCSSKSSSNSIFLSSNRSDSSFNRRCSINNCSTSLNMK